jgi:iron-sulfur cluster insertion protein
MVVEAIQDSMAELGQGPALSISEQAAGKLAALLQERAKPDHGLRVFISGMGCSGLQYGLALDDAPGDTDIVIESHGVKLYLDQASSQYMWGASIDFVETPQGGAFSINNPNAPQVSCGSSCAGCG